MVWYKLVSINDIEVVYNYWPERLTADYGTLSYNLQTNEPVLIKKSEDDVVFNYRGHVLRRIKEF